MENTNDITKADILVKVPVIKDKHYYYSSIKDLGDTYKLSLSTDDLIFSDDEDTKNSAWTNLTPYLYSTINTAVLCNKELFNDKIEPLVKMSDVYIYGIDRNLVTPITTQELDLEDHSIFRLRTNQNLVLTKLYKLALIVSKDNKLSLRRVDLNKTEDTETTEINSKGQISNSFSYSDIH